MSLHNYPSLIRYSQFKLILRGFDLSFLTKELICLTNLKLRTQLKIPEAGTNSVPEQCGNFMWCRVTYIPNYTFS